MKPTHLIYMDGKHIGAYHMQDDDYKNYPIGSIWYFCGNNYRTIEGTNWLEMTNKEYIFNEIEEIDIDPDLVALNETLLLLL